MVLSVQFAVSAWIAGLVPSRDEWRALVLAPVLAVLLAVCHMILPRRGELRNEE
jgi:hypothetical protein